MRVVAAVPEPRGPHGAPSAGVVRRREDADEELRRREGRGDDGDVAALGVADRPARGLRVFEPRARRRRRVVVVAPVEGLLALLGRVVGDAVGPVAQDGHAARRARHLEPRRREALELLAHEVDGHGAAVVPAAERVVAHGAGDEGVAVGDGPAAGRELREAPDPREVALRRLVAEEQEERRPPQRRRAVQVGRDVAVRVRRALVGRVRAPEVERVERGARQRRGPPDQRRDARRHGHLAEAPPRRQG